MSYFNNNRKEWGWRERGGGRQGGRRNFSIWFLEFDGFGFFILLVCALTEVRCQY